MGITIQQHRAAIGTFHGRRIQRVSSSPDLMSDQDPPHFEEQSPNTTLRGPWKLHALVLWMSLSLPLLLALMPTQRAASLLLIGGVEPHPGPTSSIDEVAQKRNTVIAELVVQSTSQDVTNVLRLYKAEMTTAQLTKVFDSKPKPHLIDTLTFLGVTDQQEFVKPAVISKLISRIQSYFSDHCSMCDTEYSIKLGEITYLECAICGQGIHLPCLARKLGKNMDELKTLTPAEIRNLIDPHGLPGLHYLCSYCAHDVIPNPNAGRLKTKKEPKAKKPKVSHSQMDDEPADTNKGNDASKSPHPSDVTDRQSRDPNHAGPDIPDDSSDSDEEHEAEPEPPVMPNRMIHKSGQDSNAPDKPIQAETKKKNKAICRFFRKGTCRHGPKGEECSFSHPAICQKLINHGANDKRGCKKGKSCKDFHPKMCPSSVSTHECLNTMCKLYHVKGTRRANSRPLSITQQRQPNHLGEQENKGQTASQPEDRGHNQVRIHGNQELSSAAAFLEYGQTQDPTAAFLEALQTGLQTMRSELMAVQASLQNTKTELLSVMDTKLKEAMPSQHQPVHLLHQAPHQQPPSVTHQLQPQMQANQQVQMPFNPLYRTALVHGPQGVTLPQY